MLGWVGQVRFGSSGTGTAGSRLFSSRGGRVGFGSGGIGAVLHRRRLCWVWPAVPGLMVPVLRGAWVGLWDYFCRHCLGSFEDSPVSFSGAGGAAQAWPSPAQREEKKEEEEEGLAVFSPALGP